MFVIGLLSNHPATRVQGMLCICAFPLLCLRALPSHSVLPLCAFPLCAPPLCSPPLCAPLLLCVCFHTLCTSITLHLCRSVLPHSILLHYLSLSLSHILCLSLPLSPSLLPCFSHSVSLFIEHLPTFAYGHTRRPSTGYSTRSCFRKNCLGSILSLKGPALPFTWPPMGLKVDVSEVSRLNQWNDIGKEGGVWLSGLLRST